MKTKLLNRCLRVAAVALLLFSVSVNVSYAQKQKKDVVVKSGSLDCLKGETKIMIEVSNDDIQFDGLSAEEYIKKKAVEDNKDQEWIAAFLLFTAEGTMQNAFAQAVGYYLRKVDIDAVYALGDKYYYFPDKGEGKQMLEIPEDEALDIKYKLEARVVSIPSTGYYAGIVSKGAVAVMEGEFVDAATGEVVAVLSYKPIEGSGTFDIKSRIMMAVFEAGHQTAACIIKEVK